MQNTNVWDISDYLISHSCVHPTYKKNSGKQFDCFHAVFSKKERKIIVMNAYKLFELLRKENVEDHQIPDHFQDGWKWTNIPWNHRLTIHMSNFINGCSVTSEQVNRENHSTSNNNLIVCLDSLHNY